MNNADHSPVTSSGTVETRPRIDSTLHDDFFFPYYSYDTAFAFTEEGSHPFTGENVTWTKPALQGNVGLTLNSRRHVTVFFDYSFATINDHYYYKAMLGLGPHFTAGAISLRFVSGIGLMNSAGGVKLFAGSYEPLLEDSVLIFRAQPLTCTFQFSANTLDLRPFQIYWGLGYSSNSLYSYEDTLFQNRIQVLTSFANVSLGVLRSSGPISLQAGVTVNALVPIDLLKDFGTDHSEARARRPVYPVLQMRLTRSFEF
jgi:hypothetical protein